MNSGKQQHKKHKVEGFVFEYCRYLRENDLDWVLEMCIKKRKVLIERRKI